MTDGCRTGGSSASDVAEKNGELMKQMMMPALTLLVMTSCLTNGRGADGGKSNVVDVRWNESTMVVPPGVGAEERVITTRLQRERIVADRLRESIVASIPKEWRHAVLAVMPACTPGTPGTLGRGQAYAFYLYNAERDEETIDLTEEVNEAMWEYISMPSMLELGLLTRATVEVLKYDDQRWGMRVTLHTFE